MYHPDCKLLSTESTFVHIFSLFLLPFTLVILITCCLLIEETTLLNNWMIFFFELIIRMYFMVYSFLICEFVDIRVSAKILNMSVIKKSPSLKNNIIGNYSHLRKPYIYHPDNCGKLISLFFNFVNSYVLKNFISFNLKLLLFSISGKDKYIFIKKNTYLLLYYWGA